MRRTLNTTQSQRRQLLKGALAIATVNALNVPLTLAHNFAGQPSIDNNSRLRVADIELLKIAPPTFTVASPPFFERVTLPRQVAVTRRFNERVYIAYENLTELHIHDGLSGSQLGILSLSDSRSPLKDFALNSLGEVFALHYGAHSISHYSATGALLQTIGQFGVEQVKQLNGPSSLSVDVNGDVHVYQPSTNQIKVFSPQSDFIRVYSASLKNLTLGLPKLDGSNPVRLVLPS